MCSVADGRIFTTSDYPSDNKYKLPLVNKKIPGLMKDELNGENITEVMALKAQTYTVIVNNKDHFKKAKGVQSSVVKTELTSDHYHDALFNKSLVFKNQCKITSKFH